MPLGIDGEGAQMNHDAVVIIAGRPEAIPYIRPLDCIVNCQLSIVNFPQPFTFTFSF